MIEELKELCDKIEEKIEATQTKIDNCDTTNEPFHGGFLEGYLYGLENLIEKLYEIVENHE